MNPLRTDVQIVSNASPAKFEKQEEARVDQLQGNIKKCFYKSDLQLLERDWEEIKGVPEEKQEDCYYNLIEGYRKQGGFEASSFNQTEAFCKKRLPPEFVQKIYSRIAHNICKEVNGIDKRFSAELLTRAQIKDYSATFLKVVDELIEEGDLQRAMDVLRCVNQDSKPLHVIKLANAFDSAGDWKNAMDCYFDGGKVNRAREYCIAKAKNFKDNGKTKEAQQVLLASSYFYLFYPKISQELKDCFKDDAFEFDKAIELSNSIKLKDTL